MPPLTADTREPPPHTANPAATHEATRFTTDTTPPPHRQTRSTPNPTPTASATTTTTIAALRRAQPAWAATPLRDRLATLRRFRKRLIHHADELADLLDDPHPHRRQTAAPRGESLVAEVLALADACKWLENNAKRALKPRRLGLRGRPLWLFGVTHDVERVPLGLVTIIGPSNYPLLLPGVQALQALAAGNAVLLKPGRQSTPITQRFAQLLTQTPTPAQAGSPATPQSPVSPVQAGSPAVPLAVVDESIATAEHAIDAADLVVMTGSHDSGRAVLRRAAARATPCIVELSGCDAMVVLPSAEYDPGLDKVADAVRTALRFNASQTCIAPRRILVPQTSLDEVEDALRDRLASVTDNPVATSISVSPATRRLIDEAVQQGAEPLIDRPDFVVLTGVSPNMTIANADVFDPVTSIIAVEDAQAAVEAVNACDYALNASVWGELREATAIARQLDVGGVAINDLIAPTADPRIPFGGTRGSGFGVTRGPEGLLAMTRPRTISTRHHGPYRHLQTITDHDVSLFRRYLRWIHG